MGSQPIFNTGLLHRMESLYRFCMVSVFCTPCIEFMTRKIRTLCAKFVLTLIHTALHDPALRRPVMPAPLRSASIAPYLIRVNTLCAPVREFFVCAQPDTAGMAIQTARGQEPATSVHHTTVQPSVVDYGATTSNETNRISLPSLSVSCMRMSYVPGSSGAVKIMVPDVLLSI